jgi:putative transposase
LEQVIHTRQDTGRLAHHSGCGFKYLSIRYTERLADADIEPGLGSLTESYTNAMAESVIGLCKAEVIYNQEPWKNHQAVEFADLAWVDWLKTGSF